MRRISKRYPGYVSIIILLFVLAAAVAFRYQMRESSENVSVTEGNSHNVSQEPEKPKPNEAFVASNFFDQIQNGMSYNQVKDLAGGTIGDCGTTDVYPDSGRMACAWNDSNLRVTVVFVHDKVTGKDKADL